MDFNPHAPHGGATSVRVEHFTNIGISIHTPRMGARHPKAYAEELAQKFQSTRPAWGRDAAEGRDRPCLGISIHTPRMGARPRGKSREDGGHLFQSTRPAWGRDQARSRRCCSAFNFNPHAPHGGATMSCLWRKENLVISIHTPRMGARPLSLCTRFGCSRFQSTRPAWGRDWG